MPRTVPLIATFALACLLVPLAVSADDIAPKPADAPPPEPVAKPGEEAAISKEEEAARKLGFYFRIDLEQLSQLGVANGIGVITDPPALLGGNFAVSGPEVDGDFGARWTLGFDLGFRLRKNHGSIEARFLQWDQQQDLFRDAGPGKAIANTLASPDAGYAEDVGFFLFPGGPNGDVDGFEAGTLSEGPEGADPESDGAEDLNGNRRPDFIRFGTSDRIVGELKTDYQVFDVDWVRTVKKLRRLTLDGRVGIRTVSLEQNTDLGYRDLGSFAVYSDDEGASRVGERTHPTGCGSSDVQDGDGDGERQATSNEPDGDGFLDGNCSNTFKDSLSSVQTITEDRVIANLKSSGAGLLLGVDGRFELGKHWRLAGKLGVTMLSGKTEYRYRETFTSERDRYPNFIDWDFNGDGVYNNLDFDFDGSCNGVVENCTPNIADQNDLPTDSAGFLFVDTRIADGALYSYSSPNVPFQGNSLGVNTNAFTAANTNHVRKGDPIPESERNTDILKETTLLNDLSGSESGFQPMLDLNVGLEYQFSKFAHFDFGVRSTRWFGAGNFRSIANQVVAGRPVQADDGDFSQTGMYFTLTIVPR